MPRFTSLLVDWVGLNSGDSPGQAYADALLRACQGLSDEVLRRLPATPDDAAAALAGAPFVDRVEGIYLPWDWFEPYSPRCGYLWQNSTAGGTSLTARTCTGARE